MNVPLLQPQPEIEYPEDNGEPMSENTLQFRWIVTFQGGLESLLRDDPNAFVAGDLLWYPVEGDATIRTAPDAMVVFGRPKKDRGSYIQWREENVAPQIVFEITSPGNRRGEMEKKLEFYDRYGVEDYYIYDPDRVTMKGYLRQGDSLAPISEMQDWRSPRLGIRFDLSGEELAVWRPDGKRFATYSELATKLDATEEKLDAAQEKLDAAEEKLDLVATERDVERQRAERLAAQLRALGISPDDI